jgi:hypothetical protein
MDVAEHVGRAAAVVNVCLQSDRRIDRVRLGIDSTRRLEVLPKTPSYAVSQKIAGYDSHN